MNRYCSLFKNNQGVALLLAVSVISLLIAVTVQFNRDTRLELFSSANALSINSLGIMAKSGYNLAEALIREDDEDNVDTLLDTWALPGEQRISELYPTASLTTRVEDLSGRLQLNSLLGTADGGDDVVAQRTREILLRLLLSDDLAEVSPEQAELIVNAISDWIDQDEEERGLESTESSFYRGLQPSYVSRNGPMVYKEELLLIRGVSRTLYFGNSEYQGLQDLVTVHGSDGTININTAPKALLKAMSPNMNEDFAIQLDEFRSENVNLEQLGDKLWYTTVVPGDVTFNSATTVTRSSFFQITSRAENGGVEKQLSVVLQRQPDAEINILTRKLE